MAIFLAFGDEAGLSNSSINVKSHRVVFFEILRGGDDIGKYSRGDDWRRLSLGNQAGGEIAAPVHQILT